MNKLHVDALIGKIQRVVDKVRKLLNNPYVAVHVAFAIF